MSAIPSTPPGTSRFAPYTSENHSAPIWIASILAFIFSFLVLAVRLLFVKWKIHGIDDVVLIIAHVSYRFRLGSDEGSLIEPLIAYWCNPLGLHVYSVGEWTWEGVDQP